MTLIDSLDSILMLYSYTGFPERKFAFFMKSGEFGSPSSLGEAPLAGHERELDEDRPEKIDMRVKMNAMSGLSILLTLISILVAFRFVVSRIVTCFKFIISPAYP
jgi:high-affinity nickel-transport protein